MFDRRKTTWLIPICLVAFGLVAAPGGAEYIADGVTVTAVDQPMVEVRQQPHRVAPTDKNGPSTINCDDYLNSVEREPPEVAEQCGGWAFGASSSLQLDRAPTDMGYSVDIWNDRFVNYTLNDFPGQTDIGPQGSSLYAIDFDADALQLWAVNYSTDMLGTIDLATGVFTAFSACLAEEVTTPFTGMTIAGDGTMYASTPTNLYILDPTNPTDCSPALVGPFGTGGLVIDIAISRSGEMYAHDIGTDSIYSVDLATGAATIVGLTGYDANYSQGLDFDGDDGTLYIFLYMGGGANIYGTVDLLTGAVIPLATDNPIGDFEGAIQVPMRISLAPNGPTIAFAEGIPSTWTTDGFGPVYWSTTDDPAATDKAYGLSGTPPGAIADADFLNGPIDPVSYQAELWTNPFSLVGTGQPMLHLLWLHRWTGQSAFGVGISTDGGASWADVLTDTVGNYPGGEASSIDLTPWIGEANVIARFTFSGEGWDWYAQVDEVSITATEPGLVLRKTIGTVPTECAATDMILVDPGDEVVYCYTATNTGNLPLTVQSLTDSELGTIFSDLPFILLPGNSVQAVISPVQVFATTTNVGTWTGFNPGPVDVAEASDTATALVFSNDECFDAEALFCPGGGGTSIVLGSTIPATESVLLDDCATSHEGGDVWYHVVGNGGDMTASLCTGFTDFDTKINVYRGDCATLVCETTNDDFCGLQSEATWTSEIGIDYYIMVYGWSGDAGDFELALTCSIPVELQTFSID